MLLDLTHAVNTSGRIFSCTRRLRAFGTTINNIELLSRRPHHSRLV